MLPDDIMTDLGIVVHGLIARMTAARARAIKYSDDQPRDEAGRWTDGGGGSGGGGGGSGGDTVSNMDPGNVEPVNSVDQDKVDLLVSRMKENGWQGDPILAYEDGTTIQALTGSHRIIAAREAGIEIQVDMIDTSAFSEYDVEIFTEMIDDEDRVRVFRELNSDGKISDEQLQIMEREANNSAWVITASQEQARQESSILKPEGDKPKENITHVNMEKLSELNNFMGRMREKYPNMYSDMSDDELGSLERLEKETYAKMQAVKTLEQYRSRLWGACVRLFNGGRDAAFEAAFMRSIDEQLTQAWNKGGADVGVDPDEMDAGDIAVRDEIIDNERFFINGLMADIQSARDSGMERDAFDKQFGARCDLWANRYKEAVNRAHMQMGSKQKFIWRLGQTEEHCDTCSKLNGIIAFGYEWEEARIQPQAPPNSALTCSGWRCDCSLEPTTRRRTGRALDRLIEIRL